MLTLLIGLLLFLGLHSLRLVAPDWREQLIRRYGVGTWKGTYSLLSLTGLTLIVYGYSLTRVEPIVVWNPVPWSRHVAGFFSLIAMVLIAAVYVPGNQIKAKLGHPMFAGIKIWAFAHLLANGRLSDLLLFGTFLLWAVAGFGLSRRRDRSAGLHYPAGTVSGTGMTLVAGSALWIVFGLWLHPVLVGVPAL